MTRDDARVYKVYFTPATPCERLLAHSSVEAAIKDKLTVQFRSLDPARLLQEIRTAQKTLSAIAAHGTAPEGVPGATADVATFLQSLSSAWKEGEVRPTHRPQSKAERWWKTRLDPFAGAWLVKEGWLVAQASIAAQVLMDRLVAMVPEIYGSETQLRTLQRRVQTWRSAHVAAMVLGGLRKTAAVPVDG